MRSRNKYVIGKSNLATTESPAAVVAVTGAEVTDEESPRLVYGWRSFTPRCLQCFNRVSVFLVVLCMGYLVQSMVVNGITGLVLSTLEKRFGLSSIMSGLIPASYDFAGAFVLIFVTYIGENSHKPRVIAVGLFLFGLGSFTFALPHFLTGIYRYNSDGPSGVQCDTHDAFDAGDNSTSVGIDSRCGVTEVDEFLSKYLFVFLLGHVLHGIGANPLQTLGVTYMDDCVKKESSALYYGTFYAVGSIGPAVGVLGGGALLDVFTDIGTIDLSSMKLTKDDPRWVGAWWVAFLSTGSLALLLVLPISGFPRDLPGAAEIRKTKVSEAHDVDGGAVTSDENFGKSLKDLPLSLKLLLKNPVFILTTLAQVTEGFVGNGTIAFGSKYLENQFNLPASQAGMIFGGIAVVAGAGGMLLISLLIKRYKWSCGTMTKILVILSVINFGLVSMFFIECNNVSFAGVTTGYNSSTTIGAMTHECNARCGCLKDRFEPVCGDDGVMYFSACYAGCRGDITPGNDVIKQKYSDCACVALNSVNSSITTAVEGVCEAKTCHLLYLFSGLIFLAVGFSLMGAILSITVVMRCVPPKQRTVGLGLYFCLIRLFGSIPGPIVFGYVLDTSCILWKSSCSKTSSCMYYSNYYMSRRMLVIMAVFKTLCLILTLTAWRLYKPIKQRNATIGEIPVEVAGDHGNSNSTSRDHNHVETNGHIGNGDVPSKHGDSGLDVGGVDNAYAYTNPAMDVSIPDVDTYM